MSFQSSFWPAPGRAQPLASEVLQIRGHNLTDLIAFAKAITPTPPAAPAGDPEIKAILKTLAENNAKLTEAQIQAVKDQNAAAIKKLEEFGNSGAGNNKPRAAKIYKPDGTLVTQLEEGDVYIVPQVQIGDSIERDKEKNRHDEEMARVTNEKSYKDSIANSVSDVAGAVVSFAGEKAVEAASKENPAAKEEIALQTFECGNCHTAFTVQPGTLRFKCPKCGAKYSSVPGEWEAPPDATDYGARFQRS